MLKINTLLTAVCLLLASITGYFAKCIWEDVATIKSLTTTQAVQVQTLTHEVDDHETRIRQTETAVTILQQDGRIARSPRMMDNNRP